MSKSKPSSMNQNLSRRNFLVNASVASGALGAVSGSLLGQTPEVVNAHPQNGTPVSSSTLDPQFGILLSAKDFEERFITLHKQLFASNEYDFNAVTTHIFTPPKGFYQVDHAFLHDGKSWHLYYTTGDLTMTEDYIRCFKACDWDGAARFSVEPGNGYAKGPDLFHLEFQKNVFFPSQGKFDKVTRGDGIFFRYQNRYGMLYDVRGENYIGMSLAWSQDMEHWDLDEGNPCLGPPAWTKVGSTCKNPHVVQYQDYYLIYYIVMDRDGYCCVALATTKDWKHFTDEGQVFRTAPMLRGTMGLESTCVFLRDGIWHLFFTYGPGVWHCVSRDPKRFTAGREGAWNVGTGFYCIGPFHAAEIMEGPDGQWWLTTDRKEETRRLNRVAGKLCYRGTYEDEKTLEEGMYLSKIRWQGDQPLLEKPTEKGPA